MCTALSLPTFVHLGGILLKEEPEELWYAQMPAGLVMHRCVQVAYRNVSFRFENINNQNIALLHYRNSEGPVTQLGCQLLVSVVPEVKFSFAS